MSDAHGRPTSALRRAAAERGIALGVAVSAADMADPAVARTVAADADLVVPDHEMKWDVLEPAPGAFAGGGLAALRAAAAARGLAVRGHAAFWHGAVPAHLSGLPPTGFGAAALSFLQRLAGAAGPLHSLDVVNEPLDPGQGRADGLRASPFLSAFGPDWCETAFRRAGELFPGVPLVLNEMGLEYDSPEAERKRSAALRLIERLVSRGAPVHALGLQSHLHASDVPANHSALSRFLDAVVQTGLRLMISELDVSDRCIRGPAATRDRMVARAYARHLDTVLSVATPAAVVVWGPHDGRSWLAAEDPRVRPLLRDRRLRRKPAWHALAAALDGRGREQWDRF